MLAAGVSGVLWWQGGAITGTIENANDVMTRMAPEIADMVEGAADTMTDAVADIAPDVLDAASGVADSLAVRLGEAAYPYTAAPGTEYKPPSQDAPTRPLPDAADAQPRITASSGSVTTQKISGPFLVLVEESIYRYTNEHRAAHGLDPLPRSPFIDPIARDHSKDMYNFLYFDHVNRHGQDPTDRATAAGYDCIKDYGTHYTYGLGENIWMIGGGYHPDPDELGKEIVADWMNSPGHRQNILESTYDAIGIGAAAGRDGSIYATQNFC